MIGNENSRTLIRIGLSRSWISPRSDTAPCPWRGLTKRTEKEEEVVTNQILPALLSCLRLIPKTKIFALCVKASWTCNFPVFSIPSWNRFTEPSLNRQWLRTQKSKLEVRRVITKSLQQWWNQEDYSNIWSEMGFESSEPLWVQRAVCLNHKCMWCDLP